MNYKWEYKTPKEFDDIIITSDGKYLTGLWFKNSKDDAKFIMNSEEKELPIFRDTCRWLDIYFKGEIPDFKPKYKIENLTSFRKQVIEEMLSIPFGTTRTYNDIAKKIAKKRGLDKMSAQAVGQAVGWNPICIIIPCHRVVGSKGNLTGYGGGMKNKVALLANEKVNMKNYTIPSK